MPSPGNELGGFMSFSITDAVVLAGVGAFAYSLYSRLIAVEAHLSEPPGEEISLEDLLASVSGGEVKLGGSFEVADEAGAEEAKFRFGFGRP
jgi:hypothetical protein